MLGVREQQRASEVWMEIHFPGTANPVTGGDWRRRCSVAWSSLEKRVCNESVIWQRLRNSELVIQSKSLGMRRTEGGGSLCSPRRFEVRLQSCRRLGGKSRWFLLWSLSTLSELWVFTVFWTLPDWVSFGSFIDYFCILLRKHLLVAGIQLTKIN